MTVGRLVRVVLNVPLGRGFDYLAEAVGPDDIGRRAVVPFGKGEAVGVIVALPEAADTDAAKLRHVIRILRDAPALPGQWTDVLSFCADYYHHPVGQAMFAALPPGLRASDPLPPVVPRASLALTPTGEAALAASPPKRGSLAARLAARLRASAAVPAMALGTPAAERLALDWLAAGWLHATPLAAPAAAGDGPALLDEQAQAVTRVTEEFGRFGCFLLHGVTGSGKTEVYLRLVEAAIARGMQALMLVPEIGLTPQLTARVRERFPHAGLEILHSGVAAGERTRGFLKALAGHTDIVLGTRLAVFTPLPRLGLVIVDEEHDASFKQQDGLRYNARDVAVLRAKQQAVPVVLGSATPALETWHAAHTGRYRLLNLTRRAVAEGMPTVKLVDIRRQQRQEGFSEAVLEAIASRLARGEQSLVFMNRRGYAPVLFCPSCGWASGCGRCAAHLVLHLADRCLRCHHCGAQAPIPRACPDCGDLDIRPQGRGTQRIEAFLAQRFPGARVLRIDRDSAATRARWHSLLAQVHNGEADILVGTQMLAKGHDFPGLTLAAVLDADGALYAADFRAPERLFAQLMQVGGRSGRAERAGEVLVQTALPDHPLYRALVRHDYAGFAALQLDERRHAGFPPFAHQAMLRAEAPRIADALAFLQQAAGLAGALAGQAVLCYDPVPMRMHRLAGLERAQLMVESTARPALQAFLRVWLAQVATVRAPRTLRWHIDVDPLEF